MSISTPGQAQAQRKPPVFIILIAVAFIAVGLLDIWRASTPLTSSSAPPGDALVVLLIGMTAVLGSMYLLKGHNWARWLLATWMALHVAVSIGDFHMLLGHVAVLALILSGLFCPAASTYFRQSDT